MLPNHAPLMVAEEFGTLATLYPNRIDLGLGRAPGTDPQTMRALRRGSGSRGEDFGEMIQELEHYLAPPVPGQKIRAIPGAGIDVPLYILGSSLFSADLAARLGRPYAFAGHFAPALMLEAFDLYRSRFQPSPHLDKPYTMAGVPVIAADSDERASFLATSLQQAFLGMVRGQRKFSSPPVADIDALWSPQEKSAVESMLGLLVTGGAAKVRRKLDDFINVTQVDELIIASDTYDPDDRLRSFAVIAQAKREP
jgi:luciferase family oxidoreductase group 1